MKTKEEAVRSLWMLPCGAADYLYQSHENDAVRLAGIADHLPKLKATDVDEDTIVWLRVEYPSGACSLVVGKSDDRKVGLCLVHVSTRRSAAAYVHDGSTLLDGADVDPHFEPEALSTVLLRMKVRSLAVRLKPRTDDEVMLVHEAERQSDVIVGFRCTAYFASNGEPVDDLINRFHRLIDHAKAEGMLTGNSEAELVRFDIIDHTIKETKS